ncbi:MAG: NAD(P)/FAD-dependent oxidoreductase [Promethearchaeota archaeon]|jgi:digeranylgeranylglycerophospholipid reductase
MVENMYEVIISGAGPAGSQCAKVISKAGYDVALIEKDINWRKPCGGAVHSSVINVYPELKKLDKTKIEGVVMHSADNHKLEFKGASDEYSIIMDRLELDTIIKNAAVDAGASLFDKNVSFDFLLKDRKKIGVLTNTPNGKKEYYGKIIIIADGMSSKLAVKSGVRGKWKRDELAIGKCAIMEGDTNLNEEYVYVYFQPFQGYGWIFPLDKNRFNIGVFTFGEDNRNYNINELFETFQGNQSVKQYLPDSNYTSIWSGAYSFPASFPAEGVLDKSLYTDNIMLIGDAGGFVSPISGEGIQTAFTSGRIAGETAVEALQNDDYSRKMFKKYRMHQEIKEIIRNFKLKRSMIPYFYENGGKNLNSMLRLSEKDSEFREQVVNMFAFGEIPSEEFLAKIKK